MEEEAIEKLLEHVLKNQLLVFLEKAVVKHPYFVDSVQRDSPMPT